MKTSAIRGTYERAALPLALIALAFAFGLNAARVDAHSPNPAHISVKVGPARTDTITSTPFDSTPYINNGSESSIPGTFSVSYGEDDCGTSHGIDYCHHHISSGSEWSVDTGSPADGSVYFSALGYTGVVTVTNYVFDITPLCSAGNPRGYTIWVEVWARLESDQIWRPLGIMTYGHVTASVVDEGWYWPGTLIGTTGEYAFYDDCFEGSHVHQDVDNYVHRSTWNSTAWIWTWVTYSSNYSSMTSLGSLGGANDSDGPDDHGGAFSGW